MIRSANERRSCSGSPSSFIILLILWLAGFSFHVGGSLIHVLFVAAVIYLIYTLATGRRVA